jgi:Hypervirulence associated proteins TUDOR domain
MTSWFFWTMCRGKRGAVTEFKKGDRVRWSSHGGEAVGTVERKITSDTEAGGRTVRASKDEPQYLVRSEKSGGTAVHKPSALRRA